MLVSKTLERTGCQNMSNPWNDAEAFRGAAIIPLAAVTSTRGNAAVGSTSPAFGCAPSRAVGDFTLDGTPAAPDGRATSRERTLHGAAYLARPEANAVIHHHARAVLLFTKRETEPGRFSHPGAISPSAPAPGLAKCRQR